MSNDSTPLVVALSGDPGAGKTAVSHLLSDALGLPRISAGEEQRRIAELHGLDILAHNIRARTNPEYDEEVDRALVRIASDGRSAVVDSRLAWHLVPHAFKVHLIVDPYVGAQRRMGSPSVTEAYQDLEVALQDLRRRQVEERERFLSSPGVDISRLRNYDFVVDTSTMRPDEVVAMIVADLAEETPAPRLLLSPKRIFPTEQPQGRLSGSEHAILETAEKGSGAATPISVGYCAPYFFVVDGHKRLSGALRGDHSFVPAVLAAEGEETVTADISAERFLVEEPRRGYIYEWEDIHGFKFSSYPSFTRA